MQNAPISILSVFPKVRAKFSQQRPSACSYTGLSTLCLNACYRGPWRAKLCRARGTALRALKRSRSPQQISGWTTILLRIRTRRSQMVKALEIPQLDKLAWVVLISLHRPLQEFSLRLKASRWPPTQELSS